MPTDLEKPETFLFAFADGSASYAVRVTGRGREAAKARFDAMSTAERRAAAVARIGGEDRDHVAELVDWFRGQFRRFAPSR